MLLALGAPAAALGGVRSTHPAGKPISASTNRGFNTGRRPAGGKPVGPARHVSGARRVLHTRKASVRLVPGFMAPAAVVCLPALLASVTTAVGHRAATEARLGLSFLGGGKSAATSIIEGECRPVDSCCLLSRAIGVGYSAATCSDSAGLPPLPAVNP